MTLRMSITCDACDIEMAEYESVKGDPIDNDEIRRVQYFGTTFLYYRLCSGCYERVAQFIDTIIAK